MALLLSASDDYAYTFATGSTFAPVSIFCRFRRDGAGGSGDDYVVYIRDPSFFSMSIQIQASTGHVGVYFQGANGGTFRCTTLAVTDGKWYEVMARATALGAGNGKVFVREVGSDTIHTGTGDGPGATYTWSVLEFSQGNATDWFRGAIDELRVWTAALSDAEVEREFRRKTPVRTSDLWTWVPMLGRTNADFGVDYSGNGRSLAASGGTVSHTDGAPVSWTTAPRISGRRLPPMLSLPGVTDITSTSARPKVSIAY